MVKLNQLQEKAVDMYLDWYFHPSKRKRPWFEISGAAGTGKTTVVNEITKQIGLTPEQVAYMAYVGKATLALRKNGLPAKTIHSSIYDLEMVKKYDDAGNPYFAEEFVKKPHLPENIIQLILDEGGMVGGKIGQDLLSYMLPMVVLGDLKQLPPVMASRMFLTEPDITLTEIMRQQKDSPIIHLSQLATNGIQIPHGIYGDNECIVIHKHELTDDHLRESDIVICGTNAMRDIINKYMREKIQHIYSNRITAGDKLVCRQNKWATKLNDDIALVNGLIGYVDEVYIDGGPHDMLINFRPEFETEKCFNKVAINHSYPFMPYEQRLKQNIRFLNGTAFEFGNAITCHLSQGSQYDTVLVYVEHPTNSLYFRQWLYTAITRAKKRLILVI